MTIQIQRCLASVLVSLAVFSKANIEKQQFVFARSFGRDISNVVDVGQEQGMNDPEFAECVETLIKIKNTPTPPGKRKLISAENEARESAVQMHNCTAYKRSKIRPNAQAGVQNQQNQPVSLLLHTGSGNSHAVSASSNSAGSTGLVLAGGGQGQVSGNSTAAAVTPNGNTANFNLRQVVLKPDVWRIWGELRSRKQRSQQAAAPAQQQAAVGGPWTTRELRQLEAVVRAAEEAVMLKDAEGQGCQQGRVLVPGEESRHVNFWRAVETEFNRCMHKTWVTFKHHATVNQRRFELPSNYRTNADCRLRWKNRRKAIFKGPWTEEEKRELREEYLRVMDQYSLHRQYFNYRDFNYYTQEVARQFSEKNKTMRPEGTHRTVPDITKQVQELRLYEQFVL